MIDQTPWKLTVRFKGEEQKPPCTMPDDGAPRGPPIAGAGGGGPGMFQVLGPTKTILVTLAAITVGALGALLPYYFL